MTYKNQFGTFHDETPSWVFTEKVKDLLDNGYQIYTDTMSGTQGEIAKVDFIKDNELYRLYAENEMAYTDANNPYHRVVVKFCRVNESKLVLNSWHKTIWNGQLENLWECKLGYIETKHDKKLFASQDDVEKCVDFIHTRRKDWYVSKNPIVTAPKMVNIIWKYAKRHHCRLTKSSIKRIERTNWGWNVFSEFGRYSIHLNYNK